MALPYPSKVFTPFDQLPASDLNEMVANDEYLETKKVTNSMLDTTTGELGGAYQTYVPTVSSQGGTPSTVTINSARSTLIGKTCHLALDIKVVNKGTATGYMRVTLPYTPFILGNVNCIGSESFATGKGITSAHRLIGAIDLALYDNATLWVDTYRVTFNATYEIA